jgi:LEA14-like dessication related protein
MKIFKYGLVAIWVLFLLVGCASLLGDFEKPQVQLVSFKPMSAEGIEQRFAIRLRILNPNNNHLNIQGMAYHLSLNGYKVVSGVSNDIPDIAAYDEGMVTLYASTNLISGGRFIFDMLQGNSDEIAYELETKIDVGTFMPTIKIVESGVLGNLQ